MQIVKANYNKVGKDRFNLTIFVRKNENSPIAVSDEIVTRADLKAFNDKHKVWKNK